MLDNIKITEIREQLSNGSISLDDIHENTIKMIESENKTVNAIVNVNSDYISKQFEGLKTKSKELPLYGVPVAVKDNICIKGIDTTCASNILKGYTAPYNAYVIDKLLSNGAVLIPRTNMDEFAMGSSTETSFFNKTKNPWDKERVPGGSSGGSCAAVASGMVPAAIGSDTGGSIRQPAAFCGVVGMKPTYGRVSRYGLIAFASSLDQIGPITTDVEDSAILLSAIAGYDKQDSTCINKDVPDYMAFLNENIKGKRVGLPKEYFIEGLDPEIKETTMAIVKKMEEAGAEIHEISLPHTEYAVATYYIIATAEASSNLARYDGVKYGLRTKSKDSLYDLYANTREEGFGQEVKRRIILGTYVLSAGYYDAYYLKAQKVRHLIRKDFNEAFKKVDFIITPTTPTTAFKLGEKMQDPLQMYLSDIFTISVNLAGLPAVSIPSGLSQNKLPMGMQIITKPFEEEKMIQIAYSAEKMLEWKNQDSKKENR